MSRDNLPLVMLPGLLNDHRLWAHQQAAFAADRPVSIPDLSQDTAIAAMAERVLDQAPPRFALAALSMGGYVAFEILKRAPERVARLALLDTMARPDEAARARVRRGLLELASLGKFKGVTPQLLPRLMHARSLDTTVPEVVMAMADAIGREGFIRQQQAIIDRADYRPVLETIRVPTLVLFGAQDEITPLAEARLIHAGIAGAHLEVLDECGHLPPLEHPERTTELLGRWLDGAFDA
ncbi:alpha/beta fold hydrolase [Pseudomonas sp. 148P]|uniref:Alpha/beta fold hydrolase n=1 Tax=Pseudomonas ulcerans TaxID=3115852 RepID=A0ABU7HYH2_9PSED|nr:MULTISPECIES: alpha/beta fold hydrolase [unclassified Pseudomonas]MEE1925139.1 alpha/beta fold hydrolase [Pseudomonas sp. 147P]MEE1936582.1 alpha/beta fold hydrolase [Pseudomonas sp. 148P]